MGGWVCEVFEASYNGYTQVLATDVWEQLKRYGHSTFRSVRYV